MKILVIQLARLGDIYQSWPTLRALRRLVPGSEIHLLCRSRFVGATEGLDAVDQVLEFNTQHLLAPLFDEVPKADLSLERFNKFIGDLQAERYDAVINLTFSGVSAWLTRLIAPAHKKVRGYTRFDDGSLAVHDAESLYFFAQVGVERQNRIHLTDVFAGVAGVDLVSEDFTPPRLPEVVATPNRIVVHLGSSDPKKCPDAETWVRLLRNFLNVDPGLTFELIGSGPDETAAQQITEVLNSPRVCNRTGTKKIFDVFGVLNGARALVGADSVAMHIASLTGTPCFNLSFNAVRFWETGPLAMGSAIYWAPQPTELIGESVNQAFRSFLDGKNEGILAIRTSSPMVRYQLLQDDTDEWSWQLIKAIYFGEAWPQTVTATQQAALQRLLEIVDLALEELNRSLQKIKPRISEAFWARVDELLQTVGSICPEVRPLLNWFDGERTQVGPSELAEILDKTKNVYTVFRQIITHIQQSNGLREQGHGNDRVDPVAGL